MSGARKPKFRVVRTCPLCGNRISAYEVTFYGHLRNEHENDFEAVAWHLSRAIRKLLNSGPSAAGKRSGGARK